MGSGFIYTQVLNLLQLDAFWCAAFFLFIDFATGVPRALLEGRFSWKRLPIAFYKAALYFTLFLTLRVVFQGLASGVKVFLDVDLAWLDFVDIVCIWLVVFREVVSIVQNVQGGLKAVGYINPAFDLVIILLRVHVFEVILSRVPGLTREQKDAAAKALDEPEELKP